MPDQPERQEHGSRSPVTSPCIRNCCLDEDDICLGCFRSLEEITAWGAVDDHKKRHILAQAAHRKKGRINYDPRI